MKVLVSLNSGEVAKSLIELLKQHSIPAELAPNGDAGKFGMRHFHPEILVPDAAYDKAKAVLDELQPHD